MATSAIASQPEPPNAQFMGVWDRIVGPKWITHRAAWHRISKPHSDTAIAALGSLAGKRVLEVGCGTGELSVELGGLVGSEGRVVAQDCVQAFLDCGHAAATARGLSNVEYVLGDAQTQGFGDAFDVILSRFGTMFFASPVAALRTLRRSLAPTGRLAITTWRALEDNDYLWVPKRIVAELLPPKPEDAVSCGPGPFSMADANVVTEMLQAAGLHDIEVIRTDAVVNVGTTMEDAIDLQLALGPAGELVREAGEVGEARMPEVRARLREELAPFERDDGVWLGSSSWTFLARPSASPPRAESPVA